MDFDMSMPDMTDVTEDVGFPPPDINALACPECGKDSFKNERGLKLHIGKMHGSTRDTVPKSRKVNLEKDLTMFFGTLGLMVGMANGTDGQIIAMNAEKNGRAWASLAAQNKQVEKLLKSIMTTSSFGEVIMAAAMTVIPILANHNMMSGIPPHFLQMMAPGVEFVPPPSPEVQNYANQNGNGGYPYDT